MVLFEVPSYIAALVGQLHYDVVDDVTGNSFEFTDSCGSMAPHLARKLASLQGVVHRGDRYIPSARQIRYKCTLMNLSSNLIMHVDLLAALFDVQVQPLKPSCTDSLRQWHDSTLQSILIVASEVLQYPCIVLL